MQNTLLFNKLLAEELNKENKYENVCLITNEILKKNHVKLSCNHCFNYKPLFQEIKKQKINFNKYETQRLKSNQIKCPYCRNVQNGILPYNEKYQKIKYVNWPENLSYKQFKCCYEFLSGKKKGLKCNKASHKNYCPNHARIMENRQKKLISKTAKKNNPITETNEIISFNTNQGAVPIFNLKLDSFYIKCQLDNELNYMNDIFPKLHIKNTKHYFKCQCQHITKKNQLCKNYIICSEKTSSKSKLTISPTFYNHYYCKLHSKHHPKMEDITLTKKNIRIDISNVPAYYLVNLDSFKGYLSKYYKQFFNSKNYKYKNFQTFIKI